MKTKIILLTVVALATLWACNQDPSAPRAPRVSKAELKEGFQNPPAAAKAQVWWHWMNGNITEDGIRKDLEWMHRIGLGGFHHFDASQSTPQIVDKKLIYMQDDWKHAFEYAIRTADSLGFEITVASSPGWSTTGGPWVKPEDGMKKLVWRQVEARGGASGIRMPAPYTTSGPYQDVPVSGEGDLSRIPKYYKDIAVLAVKVPDGQQALPAAKVRSSNGRFDYAALNDGDLSNARPLNKVAGGQSWLAFDFPKEVTVRSLVYALSGTNEGWPRPKPTYALESSTDGRNYTKICDIRPTGATLTTVSVPATRSKHFRLSILSPMQGGVTNIAEFRMLPYTRVNMSENKSGFSTEPKPTDNPTHADGQEVYARTRDIVDLTAKMDSDGRLDWTAPEGNWRIYRFGWSLTGKQNHPAPPEATGLEVDKMDSKAFGEYMRVYLDMYRDATKGLMGKKGIQYVLTDSYEAKQANWTPGMFDEFARRRGYDMHLWLPALAGEVLNSPAESDAFLWDYRKTMGELTAENFDLITEIAIQEYGMRGRYSESHESGRAFIVDGMDVKATSQIPMSAIWTPNGSVTETSVPDLSVRAADLKESSSVAHIYGQNLAAAESMTTFGPGYAFCPANLKYVADVELANGINRFVIHESSHQPDDVHVPGMTLGPFGQYFSRHETWAEMAGPWIHYLSSSSFMLQAGRNVADVLWYYGEDSNVTNEFARPITEVPAGYQWDYCSPGVLLGEVSPDRNGGLTARSGARYQLLWMSQNMEYMSVPVLRRLAELARAGVQIGGRRALHPASATDSQEEFDALIRDIWDSGRANVHETADMRTALSEAGIAPDADVPEGFQFAHRDGGPTQIYWVNKPTADYRSLTVSFRTAGGKPEIWHADTGCIEEASYRVVDGRTEVRLDLVPEDAVFVVFSGRGKAAQEVKRAAEKAGAPLTGPWQVAFQAGRGAPASASFPALQSYTESDDPGIRYFSGVAAYSHSFEVEGTPGRILCDLGEVRDIAEVWVNGTYCGTAWKAPFRVDISDAVRPGANSLEVRVANMWVNRLIGDEQPGVERIAYTDRQFYRADGTLIPAGLIGPVKFVNMVNE